ncbi:type II secretion system protein GspD [Oceanimonas marisflavi]|uniref:type II secretion system protein GspD n=1 Tax=Oceanimonas marisflavi TaxID=2059724 RepID=UPI0013007F85|nr:secretin N-terminal domain-containing protein [Oceanimonas marisflavi]
MDMLSRQQKLNIMLATGVSGPVSVNLYEVETSRAIQMIAESANFVVERRHGSYFIRKREDVGKYSYNNLTELKTFKVQYSDPVAIQDILSKYISSYGNITALPERGLLVVEDKPEFLTRIGELLEEIDRQPRQILIEAKIFDVTLQDSDVFGIDWATIFKGGQGIAGTSGLVPGNDGIFIDLATPDLELFFNALQTKNRLHTVSTPKILALEDQEASTVIGDRQGFKVTTTINQITTESVDFLESGVILKVKPAVDEANRILLQIHPEVSTGTVNQQGIPSQSTTEVTTQMLVNSGQTVFIGGLIRQTTEEGVKGVPVLMHIPLLGRLFRQTTHTDVQTETVVLITPYLVKDGMLPSAPEPRLSMTVSP